MNQLSRVSIAFGFFLTMLPGHILAGQFWMESVSHSKQYYGVPQGHVRVVASSVARFRGTVSQTDKHWQISAGIRPSGGNYQFGTANNGGSIVPAMIIRCDENSCGGNAIMPLCKGVHQNNTFTAQGNVAINNNWGNKTDSMTNGPHILTCPTAGGGHQEPFDDDPYNDPGAELGDEGYSPIILDLDRNDFHLVGPGEPVLFDLDADGLPEELSWTQAGHLDGFLALDRNGNGLIDDGTELFGNYTPLPNGERAAHGFAVLAALDSTNGNGDGVLDPLDQVFSDLLVWIDLNHDGLSQAHELATLADRGIQRLEIDFVENSRRDHHGNRFLYNSRAWVEGPGNAYLPVKTSDVFFVGAD